jgi:hypothetical protein
VQACKKIGSNNDIIRFAVNDIINSGSDLRFVENMPIPGAAGILVWAGCL